MTFREGPSVIKVSTLAALFICNYGVVTYLLNDQMESFNSAYELNN